MEVFYSGSNDDYDFRDEQDTASSDRREGQKS